MGYLIRFDKGEKGNDAFQIIWEALQMTSRRPQNVPEIRAAVQLMDKLESISIDTQLNAMLQCPRCKENVRFGDSPQIVNQWRIETARTLKDPAESMFLEDPSFSYLKEAMTPIQVPMARWKALGQFWDLIEDAEKNWSGAEPELRQRASDQAAA
jgi:hypothetical protein